jgi:hypothetical protein
MRRIARPEAFVITQTAGSGPVAPSAAALRGHDAPEGKAMLPRESPRGYVAPMRRIVLLALTAAALLGLAAPAPAATISNGTVSLGVNPSGDLNDPNTGVGVRYDPTGNDGTFPGCPCEGWGAGAGGPTQFEGRANEDLGGESPELQDVSFPTSATSAVSTVDVLRGSTPALRVRQDYHPSPTTPNLYEITITLSNLTGASLTDVRYERDMDWDIEPTPSDEFVTIDRGTTPPANLIYSDDNGFGDTLPFSARDGASGNGPRDASTLNANYVDKGPADQGARFTFTFGTLAPAQSKQFFLYYGAAGTEADADAAVSAAALETYSYGQPDLLTASDPSSRCPGPATVCDGPDLGKPNTFIWGFRAVGGRPIIPPTLTVAPPSGSGTVGSGTSATATLRVSQGNSVPGAKLVFAVTGANPGGAARTTDGNGQATFAYTGANAGDDTIAACLDSNDNGSCDSGEVTGTASRSWQAPQQQVEATVTQSPQPILGQTVVAGAVGGTVKVKGKDGKFHTLGANEAIPLGSTVDATKGRVRLTAAAGPSGQVQTADFYQGAFVVTQTGGKKPITQLALAGALACPTKGKASTAARRRKVRRLWGDGHGRFRTRGRRAAATVRGTKWLTEDRCDSTKITVKRGIVSVRDYVKRKTVLVKKGHSYVAQVKKKRKP